MKPLRIVHMTSVHKHTDIRIFQKECVTLANHGYDVYLVAPDVEATTDNGVHIVGIDRGKNRLSRLLLASARVFRAAIALKPDICHIHDPELLLWVPLMRAMGKRVVYDMHENTPKSVFSKPWIPPYLRGLVSSVFKFAERMLAHKTQVIFAESDYIASYPWITDGEVVLNMPLADHLLEIEQPESPEPVIAYLGAISRDRGAFTTIEALKILAERGMKIKWLCIGPVNGNARTEMDRLVIKYSLQDAVEILGYTPPKQAWEMIAGCWCGMATLLPAPNYVTSYPTKIFEYMALGIPVVCSNFPLYREVVEGCGCGLCVDSTDPAAIADSIEKLVSDTGLRQKMGENGRQAVRDKYNWNIQAEKLLAVYKKLESHIRK